MSRPGGFAARTWWLGLVAILGLGAWLRIAGLAYGLPDVYNPDEIAIMSRALGFATGDLNPHNFLYPTFYFYVLFAWVGAFFAAGWAWGAWTSVADFQRHFFADPSAVYLAGRALSVACGVATLAVVYRLGRDLLSRGAGLVAALLLATAPFAVRDAHYVKHDVPVTLAATLALLAITRVWPGRGHTRAIVVAAAAVGAAASTHYYAVFLGVPLALGIWFRSRSDGARALLRDLALAAAVSAAAFVVLSPFLVVEPGTAWRDVVANRQIVVDRAAGRSLFASAGTYVRMLATDAMGWPVALLAVAGTWRFARRDPRTTALIVAFPAVFLLFISNTVPATRYLNPVLPMMALLAAAAVFAGVNRSATEPGSGRSWRGLLIVALVVAAALPGLAASIRTGQFFRQADTRTQARQFIESHVPAGSTVLVQAYTVQLTPTRQALLDALRQHRGPGAVPGGRMAGLLGVTPYPEPAYRVMYLGAEATDWERLYLPYPTHAADALQGLRRAGVSVVVVRRPSRAQPVVRPLLVALDRGGRRLAVFSPYPDGTPDAVRVSVPPFQHNTDARLHPALERPGPVIEVWAIGAGQ